MRILTVKDVSKSFASTAANRNITLSVEQGEIIGLVGENGSGKTTFMRILSGIIFKDSGSVEWNRDAVSGVGAVIESPAFFPEMSALDNLIYQAKLCGESAARAKEVLSLVGLQDTGKKKSKNFSLGMKQRLGIGIALIGRPQFLILDEPTNGLDPQGIIEMRHFLLDTVSKEKMTILISSHILTELSQLATHFVFIHKGQVIKEISASALQSELSKKLVFTTASPVPREKLEAAVSDGCFEDFGLSSDCHGVLFRINDYAKTAALLSEIGVTEFRTVEDTLETFYVNLIASIGGAQ